MHTCLTKVKSVAPELLEIGCSASLAIPGIQRDLEARNYIRRAQYTQREGA
jgi:hypothetical protein